MAGFAYQRLPRSLDHASISPTAERDWARRGWDAVFDPPAAKPGSGFHPVVIRASGIVDGGIDGAAADATFRVTFEPPPDSGFVREVEIISTDANGAFSTADGRSGQIDWLSNKLPCREIQFFGGDLQPLTPEQIAALPEEDRGNSIGKCYPVAPDLGYRLTLTGFAGLKAGCPMVFDARTKVRLSQLASCSGDGHPTRTSGNAEVSCWHPAQARIAIPVYHDPTAADLRPEPGERFAAPDFAATVLAIRDAPVPQGCGAGRDSAEIWLAGSSKEIGANVLVHLQPADQFEALTVEAIRADGTAVALNRCGGFREFIANYTGRIAAAEIESLRLTYRHKSTLLVLEIAKIPGMPPENAGITDLLDARFYPGRFLAAQENRGSPYRALQMNPESFPDGSEEVGPEGMLLRDYLRAIERKSGPLRIDPNHFFFVGR
ncbi:MAG: hypothetical protein R3F11_27510 [Verrucomicrobiales bacterium]